MIALIWLFLVAITLWFSKKWLQAQKYADLPGPAWYLSLPLIGHAYMLGPNPCKKMFELKKKYGNIFRFDVGSFPTVILTSKSLIGDAFKREEFSGRIWNEVPILKTQAATDRDTGNVQLLRVWTLAQYMSLFNIQRGVQAKTDL